MDGESRNLQNEFFNAARKERATVTVFLGNGKRLTGRIKSFDKFTLLLENHQGDQIVFKHAISTVMAGARTADGFDERDRSSEAVDRQPIHGGGD
jgi:host factor-I protein